MERLYKAHDGKVFTEHRECLEHEIILLGLYQNDFLFLDKEKQKINVNNNDVFSAFDKAYYFYISSELAAKHFNSVLDEFTCFYGIEILPYQWYKQDGMLYRETDEKIDC